MLNLSDIKTKSFKYIIDLLIEEYHNPLRHMILDIESIMNVINNTLTCGINKEKIAIAKEIFKQFKYEVIRHIDREEEVFFPKILELEKGVLKNKSKIEYYLKVQKLEHNEIESYLLSGKDMINKICKNNSENIFIELKKTVDKLYKETIDHVYIENMILDDRVEKLLEKF